MMVMETVELEIREQVARYLKGEIALQAFHDWFLPEAWNIDKRAAAASAGLAHEIQLLLFEVEHGDWSEKELKQRLRSTIRYEIASLSGVSVLAESSTGPDFRWADITLAERSRLEFVDIRFEEASA
jgi:hypothetical protein